MPEANMSTLTVREPMGPEPMGPEPMGLEPIASRASPEPATPPSKTTAMTTGMAASTKGQVSVQELRALAAARDKVAERLPFRPLGMTGGQVAIIALVLVVAVVAASVLLWRSRPVASAVTTLNSSAPAGPGVGATSPTSGTTDSRSGGARSGGAQSADDTPAGANTTASGARANHDAPASDTTSVPATVLIHVAGKVARPGVVRVAEGARVVDAIDAAGGALPGVDLRTVNLARVVADGEQVLVGLPPEDGAPAPTGLGSPGGDPGPGGKDGNAQPINLNTATVQELQMLPGVGPVLAERVVAYRTEHGGFTAVDELLDVNGIGEVTFGELEPLVTVN